MLVQRTLRSVLVTVCLLPVVHSAEAPKQLTVTPEEAESVRPIGQQAAEVLMASLKEQLAAAMRKGGPGFAVEFCNEKAHALTAEAAASLDGLGLKRTTLRPRNPANAADSLEVLALHQYADAGKASQEPFLIQKFERQGQVFYRYYQPIYTAGVCLACHGTRIPAGVQETLAKNYPNDQATGYTDGGFRGLIRVEIPEKRPNPQ